MNNRALITIGVLILLTIACSLVAIFVARMRRVFWIVGLALTLFEFGGITIGIAFIAISHKHLNGRGFVMLLLNGIAAWTITQSLFAKIKEPKHNSPVVSD
jgi:hypothetical protein